MFNWIWGSTDTPTTEPSLTTSEMTSTIDVIEPEIKLSQDLTLEPDNTTASGLTPLQIDELNTNLKQQIDDTFAPIQHQFQESLKLLSDNFELTPTELSTLKSEFNVPTMPLPSLPTTDIMTQTEDTLNYQHDITPIIDDLIEEIDSFTDLVDNFEVDSDICLEVSTDDCQKTLNESERNIMSDCLDVMSLDGVEFCEQMEKYSCIMAGSFPLQCLLTEYYVGSDINLFVSEAPEYYAFSSWLSHRYQVEGQWQELTLPSLIMSKKYQITSETCININLIKTNDLSQYLNLVADFSFCRTQFDGVHFDCTELSLRKVGTLEYIELFHEFPLSNLIRRIQKYQRRGYIILGADQYLNSYFNLEHPKQD